MVDMKPGSRWKSAVCDTELVVVRPPKVPIVLECGGHPVGALADVKPDGLALEANHSGGCQAGKRFADETSGLELLCTKGGAGSLSVEGRLITVKETKKLPASD
jgi:hypothetical protein